MQGLSIKDDLLPIMASAYKHGRLDDISLVKSSTNKLCTKHRHARMQCHCARITIVIYLSSLM